MSKFHNSIYGEKLALHFHAFFILAALFFAGFSVAVAVALEPLITFAAVFHIEHLYASVFGCYVLAVLSALLNIAQVIWHLLACREHTDYLKELERPLSPTS